MRTRPSLLLATGWICSATVAAGAAADDFSASLTLTSDYVYRGVSQSDGDPAVQGGFDFENEAGWVLGVWASSVQFPSPPLRENPRDLELDFYVGYRLDLGETWGGNLTLTRYTYPGAGTAHYDYDEVKASINFEDLVAASLSYTADPFGIEGRGLVWELLGRWPLGNRTEISGGLGWFKLDGILDVGYAYWNATASRSVGRLTLAATYINSDGEAERVWSPELTDARLVVSLSASID